MTKNNQPAEQIESNKTFKNYKEYEEYVFNRMDNDMELSQPNDEEMDMIHSMAKSYLEILMKDLIRNNKKVNINKVYQLLFKLNMLTPDEEEH